MSDAPPDEVEIAGVTVRKAQRPSGPVWQWREERAPGVTLHNEIMWVEENYRWLRGTSVTDEIDEGGWNHYSVHYERAYDEKAAWAVVFGVITRELEGKAREWDSAGK